MYIGIVQPHRGREERRVARVGDGLRLELSPDDLERLRLAEGSVVEVRRTPDGLLILSPDTSPSKLYVELTTDCNLDCPMCMRRSWEEEGGAMPAAHSRQIVPVSGQD